MVDLKRRERRTGSDQPGKQRKGWKENKDMELMGRDFDSFQRERWTGSLGRIGWGSRDSLRQRFGVTDRYQWKKVGMVARLSKGRHAPDFHTLVS